MVCSKQTDNLLSRLVCWPKPEALLDIVGNCCLSKMRMTGAGKITGFHVMYDCCLPHLESGDSDWLGFCGKLEYDIQVYNRFALKNENALFFLSDFDWPGLCGPRIQPLALVCLSCSVLVDGLLLVLPWVSQVVCLVVGIMDGVTVAGWSR